jgi:acyl-[acyl-carrier-protein]-phospholipid O-acyltransferase/long-chain-fatty-acid--[acyl-carrier-protein] ligase
MILLRILIQWTVRVLFRFRAFHVEVLKTPGPVLLIPNHVSWIDWLFIGLCLEEDWRFVTSSVSAQTGWLHRRIMVNRRTFPIDPASPYAVKRMAEYLRRGGRLVLFAEGRISMTGTLMKLFEGTGFLLHKTDARVILAYLRGANRLRWVRHPGWRRWFPKVTVHFSELLTVPRARQASTGMARQELTRWLRDQMERQQFEVEMRLGPGHVLVAVEETARLQPQRVVFEDASHAVLTYRRLMAGVRALADGWGRNGQGGRFRDAATVGVLLPNVNAMPLVLLSLWAAGRVPAVLNFSTGVPTMLACANLAGLTEVITSRLFLERARIQATDFEAAGIKLLYLEDVRAQIGACRKVWALVRQVLCLPMRPPAGPETTAVILFTSGSEGTPKGVKLTHRNLLANIRQMLAVTDITDQDRVFNALPLFHSFGLTVGLLLPLIRGLYTFLYPSPLHYRMIPSAVYDRNCTIMLGTNTFLNGYARKAHPYDFRGIRYLFAAAEKLQETTASFWARQFGVRVLEGYGATECSPALCVNTPQAPRFGSVGRFLPLLEYRLEPVEGVAEGGRLFVRGPNVMAGYLNADADAKFQALGGWYDTGDIAQVDEDGFVFLLGRLKRFAKVSGEMVSLTAVEEALAGAFPQFGLRCQLAVLGRPDEEKGEALVVITNEPKVTLEAVRAVIKAKGMTNLCVPRELKVVREIPKLGTGKINHRELAQLITGAESR